MYIIKIICGLNDRHGLDYYTGSKYRVNGEKYVTVGSRDNAKRYSSKRRAEMAAERFCGSTANVTDFEIELIICQS
jgi:hypothetical protein